MPGFQIHLAIAKRYIEKHNVTEPDKFLEGSIAPDFQLPKSKSHYSKTDITDKLVEHLENKVDIERFLSENEVKSDYDKGILLHLLTDKIFFTEFFDREYIENVTYKEFCEDLYISYNKTNKYLEEKYKINLTEELIEKMKQNIQQSRKEKRLSEGNGREIIPIEKLDAFIERMSDINLAEYYKK